MRVSLGALLVASAEPRLALAGQLSLGSVPVQAVWIMAEVVGQAALLAALAERLCRGVRLQPSAQVAGFQRLFLVFGAVFVLQAV